MNRVIQHRKNGIIVPHLEDDVIELPDTKRPTRVRSAAVSTRTAGKPAVALVANNQEIHPSYIWSDGDDYAHAPKANTSSPSLTMRSIRMQALICSDILSVIAAVATGYWVSVLIRWFVGTSTPEDNFRLLENVGLMMGCGAVVLCVLSWSWGHYTRFRPFWTEIFEILKSAFYLAAFHSVFLFAVKIHFSRLWVVSALVLLLIIVPLFRYICRRMLHLKGWWLKPTCIVGVGKNAVQTSRALLSDSWMGHKVIGFVDLDSSLPPYAQLEGLPVYRTIAEPVELNRSVAEKPCVVFALNSSSQMHEYRHEINRYIMASSHATISPPISGLPLYGAEIINVYRHDSVIVKLQNKINCQSSRVVKRVFDLVLSALLLVLLTPVLGTLALLIRRDGGSAVYGHRRIGRDGHSFYCLKFRSMAVDSDLQLKRHLEANPAARVEWEANHKLKEDPRVTSIGKFIRKTSLDELPQLWNVIKGEMSLVGPRPIVMDECEKYGENLPYYLSMLPGITGLWQSSGRSDTDYTNRVSLDVWYARNWSLWQDFVILARTPVSLLKVEGAY